MYHDAVWLFVARFCHTARQVQKGDADDGRCGQRENRARAGGIQVIARAAAVLRALKDTPTGLSLGQIAERVGLPRSTVQRIVQALQDERLRDRLGAGGGVRLGPELHALAEAAHFNVVDRCRPILQSLAEATGETVDLSVLRGGRMIFLDQVQGTHRLRAVSSVGEVFRSPPPPMAGLSGPAPDAEARKLAEAEWAHGEGSGDWDPLSGILAEAKQTGMAADDDAHTEGISALGIAFRDFSGDITRFPCRCPPAALPNSGP